MIFMACCRMRVVGGFATPMMAFMNQPHGNQAVPLQPEATYYVTPQAPTNGDASLTSSVVAQPMNGVAAHPVAIVRRSRSPSLLYRNRLSRPQMMAAFLARTTPLMRPTGGH